MYREDREGGAQFAAVVISRPIQVHSEPDLRNGFREHLRVSNLFYAERRINVLVARYRSTFINPGPELPASAARDRICLHGFENPVLGRGGHRTRNAHALAGAILTRELPTTTWIRADDG
jgi:hypothetical protein